MLPSYNLTSFLASKSMKETYSKSIQTKITVTMRSFRLILEVCNHLTTHIHHTLVCFPCKFHHSHQHTTTKEDYLGK